MVAQPFLGQGVAVAVVGYRTFPDGNVSDQVNDLEKASRELTRRYPNLTLPQSHSDLGVCVMGHSSGAHIAMQMLVNRLLRQYSPPTTIHNDDKDSTTTTTSSGDQIMRIDSFIGMSAPYEIASHYEFESLRGLEELSPMKAACGYDKKRLSDYSPVLQLFQNIVTRPRVEQHRFHEACPRIALIHGVQDETVPYTSSRQAARLLSLSGIPKLEEMFLSEAGHSDTVLELMFGGKTQDAVMEWLLTETRLSSNQIS
jgi:acetyl esterase/lipase